VKNISIDFANTEVGRERLILFFSRVLKKLEKKITVRKGTK
jgi:hypothetical protein